MVTAFFEEGFLIVVSREFELSPNNWL